MSEQFSNRRKPQTNKHSIKQRFCDGSNHTETIKNLYEANRLVPGKINTLSDGRHKG